MTSIDDQTQRLLPGIEDEPAWPTLHAHLILLAAHGLDPITHLTNAMGERDLTGARDRAAVLSWRLDPASLSEAVPGPLPWLPSAPPTLLRDAEFGPWLTRRAALVAELADEVKDQVISESASPAWVTPGTRTPDTTTVVDVEIWRAAMGVDPADRRPTGPVQVSRAAFEHQHQLLARVRDGQAPALAEWRDTLHALDPAIDRDAFTRNLAEHLAALSRASIDAHALVLTAAAAGPLPDDHAASALWWRITRILTRDALTSAHQRLTPGQCTDQLPDVIGKDSAQELQQSPFWAALIRLVDTALERGHTLETLMRPASVTPDMDRCLSLICQIATLTEGPPDDQKAPTEDLPPVDLDVGRPIPDEHVNVDPGDAEFPVEQQLALAGLLRQRLGRPEESEEDVRRMFARADAWRDCPVPRARLTQVNQLAQDFFGARLPGSWAQAYLAERFRADLTGDPLVRPGYAPDGWTGLVRHLRSHGVSDEEMSLAGVALRARRTGGLIDHFRDRVLFPIADADGDILGFVARRHPDADDSSGPKYLNTGETPLFHKGDQLYGALRPDTIPVIVEGPMDAIAVTLAGHGRYTGLAPLGTALTEQQASLLYGHDQVIIATDADAAGRAAAYRDYWQLTAWGIDPSRAHLPQGTDPASILTILGPAAIQGILDKSTPAANQMINDLTVGLPLDQILDHSTRILAARPASTWQPTTARIAQTLGINIETVSAALARHVDAWNSDPRQAARQFAVQDAEIRRRLRDTENGVQSKPFSGRVDRAAVERARRVARPTEHAVDTEPAAPTKIAPTSNG